MTCKPPIFAVFIVALAPVTALAETTRPCFETNPNAEPTVTVAACTDFILSETGDPVRQSEAHAMRGIARRELGLLDESIADLEKAIDLNPDPRHMRMLAWTFREIGRLDAAEALYTQVLETDDHWQGWLSRCVVRQDMERYRDAATDCQAALARDPDNTDALFFAARTYNFLNDGAQALPLARKGRDLAPEDPRHMVEEVWATYFVTGPRAARALAMKGLVQFPDNAGLLDFLDATR